LSITVGKHDNAGLLYQAGLCGERQQTRVFLQAAMSVRTPQAAMPVSLGSQARALPAAFGTHALALGSISGGA
jgi:hypothetical protein